MIPTLFPSVSLATVDHAVPSGIVMVGRNSKRETSVRYYSLSGEHILIAKLKSEATGTLVPPGFQGNYFPSPNGNYLMAWASNLDGSEHLVTVWSTGPLKEVKTKKFKEVLQARWLFGRNAVSAIERTEKGPQGWVLDLHSRKTIGPMKNVIGLIDRPGSEYLLKVAVHSKPQKGLSLQYLQDRKSFSAALSAGTVRFGESKDLNKWLPIQPLTAAKKYVNSKARTGTDCAVFTQWSSSNTNTLGFRGNWLTRSQDLIPPKLNPSMTEFGTAVDSFSDGLKVTGRFERHARQDGATFLSMMKRGEVVYTLPLHSDLEELKKYENAKSRLSLNPSNDATMLAVRRHQGKTKKWIATGLPRQWWGFFLWKP